MQSVSSGAKKSSWLFFGPSTTTLFFCAGSATRQKTQGADGDAGAAHRAGDICKVPRIADGPGIHAAYSEADMGKLTPSGECGDGARWFGNARQRIQHMMGQCAASKVITNHNNNNNNYYYYYYYYCYCHY